MTSSSDRTHSSRRRRELDVLVAGELLVDLIGAEPAPGLGSTERFERHAGGSAANLASNLARLGNRVTLVASVGADGLGDFLRRSVEAAGVPTEHIHVAPDAATSLVVLSRTEGTAEFLAYRGADALIRGEQIPDELIAGSTLFHTSCFTLSREPARSAALGAGRRAAEGGGRLSLDANYAPAIWPNRREALEVVAEYCRSGALVKASTDDVARLFGEPPPAPSEAAARLLGWGASLVCVTEGARGCLVAWDDGRHLEQVGSRPVPVADATGAGDAFWAGFLTAWLDGRQPPECARAGSRLAARKLAVVGPLTGPLSRRELYAEDTDAP